MNNWEQVVGTAGDWALLLACPGVLLFTILYGVRSRWRSTDAGRSVFWLALSLSALTVLVFWAALDRANHWNTDSARVVFRLLAYSFVLVASWRLVYTLSRYQRHEAQQRQQDRQTVRDHQQLADDQRDLAGDQRDLAEGRRKLTEDQQRGPLGS